MTRNNEDPDLSAPCSFKPGSPQFLEAVLAAAREEQDGHPDWDWSAVHLYWRLFPGAKAFATKSSGVSNAVRTLHRRGLIQRVTPGRYRVTPEASQ